MVVAPVQGRLTVVWRVSILSTNSDAWMRSTTRWGVSCEMNM